MPEDALRAADALSLSPAEAFANLASTWGKFDSALRESIGAAGELAFVKLLTSAVAAPVEHVAAVSDGYGYDVAVHSRPLPVHIELKTTTRLSRLTVHLSRNEYETMRRDSAWHLVAVRLNPNLDITALATIPKEWISQHVPCDRGTSGRWESCRLEIPPGIPEPGLATLGPNLLADAPGLMCGSVPWQG
ncbi:hypothetical protein GCM10009630_65080 [Kribbella jejuensis]